MTDKLLDKINTVKISNLIKCEDRERSVRVIEFDDGIRFYIPENFIAVRKSCFPHDPLFFKESFFSSKIENEEFVLYNRDVPIVDLNTIIEIERKAETQFEFIKDLISFSTFVSFLFKETNLYEISILVYTDDYRSDYVYYNQSETPDIFNTIINKELINYDISFKQRE